MRKLLKVLLSVVGTLVLLLVLLVAYLTVVEYRPEARSSEPVTGCAAKTAEPGDTLTLLTWNTGYGALGDNADFFMDGGSHVYTSDRQRVEQNAATMTAYVQELEPDICLLQEVDRDSDRSYHTDLQAAFTRALPGYASAWATNYQAFVPYPIPPVGRVNSGLLSFSKLNISEAERISLPSAFSWPLRMGMLKRCLLLTRIPLENTDRELVVINLHVEAYDEGSGKAEQTVFLRGILDEEIAKGNYVIAGGDFNQVFGPESLEKYPQNADLWKPPMMDSSAFSERLTVVTDLTVPTCRSLDRPLAGADRSDFQYYVIDGFIVSSNLQVDRVETQDLGFVSSDHNPVLLQVTLMKEEEE